MKKAILASVVALLFSACSTKPFTGTFTGFPTDTVMMFHYRVADIDNPDIVTDTVLLKDGSFSYVPSNEGYRIYEIYPFADGNVVGGELSAVRFFAEKGDKVEISAVMQDDSSVSFDVKGSDVNSLCSAYHEMMRPAVKELTVLSNNVYMLYLTSEGKSPEVDSLVALVDSKTSDYYSSMISVIKENPSNPFVSYMTMLLPPDSMGTVLASVDGSVFRSEMSSYIEKASDAYDSSRIRKEAESSVKVGMPAPDFTLPDKDGHMASLSSFRGRVVILDFWGSWCGWCIKGIPELKEVYDEYAGLVEVIGIACRDRREDWLDAVDEHELRWVNLYENPNMPEKDKVSNRYAVKGYPTKILVDSEGTIRNIALGEDPAFYEAVREVVKAKEE